MSGKIEKDQNLKEVEREQQQEKKNESITDQSRVPNEQHRLKDQENLRK